MLMAALHWHSYHLPYSSHIDGVSISQQFHGQNVIIGLHKFKLIQETSFVQGWPAYVTQETTIGGGNEEYFDISMKLGLDHIHHNVLEAMMGGDGEGTTLYGLHCLVHQLIDRVHSSPTFVVLGRCGAVAFICATLENVFAIVDTFPSMAGGGLILERSVKRALHTVHGESAYCRAMNRVAVSRKKAE